MLAIVTPAGDPNLLTVGEMRVAAGLAADDNSQDPALAELNREVSVLLASACRVPRAGAAPLTLRLETVAQTFALDCRDSGLWLSRRPVTEIVSITSAGVALPIDAYQLDGIALSRWSSVRRTDWPIGRYLVTYKAGWADVPVELKLAAKKMVASLRTEATRDPALKRVEIPGVLTEEFWVGPKDDPLIPADVAALITPFVNLTLEQ